MDALGNGASLRPIAVIGATGAVGGRFVEIVAGQDRAPLRILVRRWWRTDRVGRFAVDLRHAPDPIEKGPRADFVAALEGCDVAVSFADGPDADPKLATALVDACRAAGTRRLVHLGCLESYGAVTSGTLDEMATPPRPPGADARRRWEFEQALLTAGAEADLETVLVTCPLIYGPFMRQGAHEPRAQVARGRVAIARGSGRCHLIFVDDVVDAVWAAATVKRALPGRVFATGPAPISWQQWFEAFESVTGRPAVAVLPDAQIESLVHNAAVTPAELRWPSTPRLGPRLVGAIGRRTVRRGSVPVPQRRLLIPTPDELAARAVDVDVPLHRASTVLGWSPVVPFEEGMRRTDAYLRWADPL